MGAENQKRVDGCYGASEECDGRGYFLSPLFVMGMYHTDAQGTRICRSIVKAKVDIADNPLCLLSGDDVS